MDESCSVGLVYICLPTTQKDRNRDSFTAHFIHSCTENQHMCSAQLHTSQLLDCFQCSVSKTSSVRHCHWWQMSKEEKWQPCYCFFHVDLNAQWPDIFTTWIMMQWHLRLITSTFFKQAHWSRTYSFVYTKGHEQQRWGGLSLELNLEHLHWALTAESWGRFSCQDPKMSESAGIFKAVAATLLIFRPLFSLWLNGTAADPKWQPVSSSAWYHQSFRSSCSKYYVTLILIQLRIDGIRHTEVQSKHGVIHENLSHLLLLQLWMEQQTQVWVTQKVEDSNNKLT